MRLYDCVHQRAYESLHEYAQAHQRIVDILASGELGELNVCWWSTYRKRVALADTLRRVVAARLIGAPPRPTFLRGPSRRRDTRVTDIHARHQRLFGRSRSERLYRPRAQLGPRQPVIGDPRIPRRSSPTSSSTGRGSVSTPIMPAAHDLS